MRDPARKMMVLGLDGAPPDIVFRERLPNLEGLMRRGLRAPLRSTHPPITVPAWSVMTTGKNPGKLGFTGFRNLTRGTYDDHWLASSQNVREPRVWDLLGKEGKRVIVHGVPQTYPPAPVHGCMTSCFLTPSLLQQWTHPPELAREIMARTGPYKFDVHEFRNRPEDVVLQDIYEATACHFRAADHLLSSRPWDFFMMVEMGTDRIQHALWRYHDPAHRKHEPGRERVILDYYRFVDEQIGRLLVHADDDTVVLVVSDHGAKRMDGAINLNDFLLERGDLVLKREPDGPTPFLPENVDWRRTRAWGMGGYYGRVFINLEGREPHGVVRREAYEPYREELKGDLAALRDDRGASMPNEITRPEDVYSGPFVKDAPDLLCYFGGLSWRAHQSVGHDSIHSPEAEVGSDDANHDWQGVFILRDPQGGPETIRRELDIRDVTPTILRAFDLPVPGDVEGRPVQGRMGA